MYNTSNMLLIDTPGGQEIVDKGLEWITIFNQALMPDKLRTTINRLAHLPNPSPDVK